MYTFSCSVLDCWLTRLRFTFGIVSSVRLSLKMVRKETSLVMSNTFSLACAISNPPEHEQVCTIKCKCPLHLDSMRSRSPRSLCAPFYSLGHSRQTPITLIRDLEIKMRLNHKVSQRLYFLTITFIYFLCPLLWT